MKVWLAFGILVLIILTIQYLPALFAQDNCPKDVYGNGSITVKYFSSPFCAACWLQKGTLKKTAIENNFMVEEYDADFCREAAAPHYIRGVPAFLVNDTITYGLQDEASLKRMVGA